MSVTENVQLSRAPGQPTAGIASSGTLAWRDLNRRPPTQVRGSKRFWRVLIALNPGNSVLYWIFGRR